ncbi:MAG TPA: ABC transporter substrate-binding protein [Nocardioides sp.]|uniref:ABC transporter substrate-binding protein n=1 Tax=Nocardioides sp. TaxID=35761 RepID=UPI002C9D7871|nr:ABC transporter substrate-binding protein [Nocardioides sp.]HTW15895.1 ABC transporter substrate-binding protein [Nocardioides sp.]
MNTTKHSIRIPALVVAAVAAVTLTACGGDDDSASASGTDSVKVAVFPSFNALGAHAAEIEGTFEKQGLDVEFVTVATPAEATPQLLGGKVDFALMDVTTPVIARSEGVPIVMVAPGATGTALNAEGMGTGNFWVAKDSDITSIEDIQNATFGIPQTKSQIWVDVRTVVDAEGGDSSKIEFVEVPNTIAALKSGSVDVVTTAEPAGTAALADPDLQHLAGFVAGGEGELAYTYVTSEKFAQSNGDTVEKFATAILDANKLLNADPALPAQIAETYVDAPAELLQKAVYQQFGEEAIDEEIVEAGIDRVLRYDLIAEEDAPAADDLLAND